jgi:hypothetical protein
LSAVFRELYIIVRVDLVGFAKRLNLETAYPRLPSGGKAMLESGMVGGIMWGMGLWGLVLFVIAALLVAVLVKYELFR